MVETTSAQEESMKREIITANGIIIVNPSWKEPYRLISLGFKLGGYEISRLTFDAAWLAAGVGFITWSTNSLILVIFIPLLIALIGLILRYADRRAEIIEETWKWAFDND